jgi:hypothetical protein
MSEGRIIIDHQKLEYEGPFDLNDLVMMMQRFLFERGFDRKLEKDFEQNTKDGLNVEWQVTSWKKISDHARFHARIRFFVSNYVKVDAVKDKKKVKVGNGKIDMIFDGFLDMDYFHKWNNRPMLIFIRSLFDKFIYKIYTDRFEQRLAYDMTHLINEVEKFFNIYRHYRIVKVTPHFAH